MSDDKKPPLSFEDVQEILRILEKIDVQRTSSQHRRAAAAAPARRWRPIEHAGLGRR
jgi:hypothetical protein